MEGAFRLRYEVYCKEKHFLPADAYPDLIEKDCFDLDAVHISVSDGTPIPIGYARLIDGFGTEGFPLLKHGVTLFDDCNILRPGVALEMSRGIVRTDVRHASMAPGDCFKELSGLPYPTARTASGLIQLKILRLTYQHAVQQGVRWIVGAMEPAMRRRLRMIGMCFDPIGPTSDYYGSVQPHAMDLRCFEEDPRSRASGLLQFFRHPGKDPHAVISKPPRLNQ